MSSKENNTFSANFGSRVSGTVKEPTTFNLNAPTITRVVERVVRLKS